MSVWAWRGNEGGGDEQVNNGFATVRLIAETISDCKASAVNLGMTLAYDSTACHNHNRGRDQNTIKSTKASCGKSKLAKKHTGGRCEMLHWLNVPHRELRSLLHWLISRAVVSAAWCILLRPKTVVTRAANKGRNNCYIC